jgi:hypothetical protein
MNRLLCLAPFALSACAHDHPGVRVETVEVVREVQRPCPGEKPVRPAPLARPLPTDAVQLAALLGAKLGEYTLPGKWADKAEAIIDRCLENDNDR